MTQASWIGYKDKYQKKRIERLMNQPAANVTSQLKVLDLKIHCKTKHILNTIMYTRPTVNTLLS